MKYETTRDERGTTYTKLLPNPVTAGFYERREATHVMVWFNRETRDWVVSFSCTGYGTQVGMSTYVGTRADADETAARYMAAAAAAGEHGRVDEWDY